MAFFYDERWLRCDDVGRTPWSGSKLEQHTFSHDQLIEAAPPFWSLL